LVGDVLRRVVEDFQNRPARVVVLERETTIPNPHDYWIREHTARAASPREACTLLGGPATVIIQSDDRDAPLAPEHAARIIRVGKVASPAHPGAALAGVLGDCEPLTLRLTLLRYQHMRPATLSTARLHRAAQSLYRWRYKVAMWAEMPSAPAVPGTVHAMRSALMAGLDTATVLTGLHRLEVDPQVASGSKFETFAYLDRVLALDLCRLIGKLHR
jgi:hypothetical protein